MPTGKTGTPLTAAQKKAVADYETQLRVAVEHISSGGNPYDWSDKGSGNGGGGGGTPHPKTTPGTAATVAKLKKEFDAPAVEAARIKEEKAAILRGGGRTTTKVSTDVDSGNQIETITTELKGRRIFERTDLVTGDKINYSLQFLNQMFQNLASYRREQL